jgi:glutathione S-transferase
VEYLDVAHAQELSGLRLVLSVGVPGPWGEAAKGILDLKGIPYLPVAQYPGAPNDALEKWTGHGNAPVAVYADERPRAGWAEILFLAERLAPEPRLVPADPRARALMFGLCHEICGEMGLGWCRRLMILDGVLAATPTGDPRRRGSERLAARYGHSAAAAEAAPGRVAEILGLLAAQLRSQQAAGSRYLLGEALSALDVYWATFAALISPLPAELCPMPALVRTWYGGTGPLVDAAVDPALLAHRDFVYERHLKLPLDF